ncbi:MAG: protein-L-isoaspartate(D-aspartate) O-methyltransferase [Alphaproteobacteria bacterium]|nr:protein-L-isoaspartate(D-aspartate) O-methyltransferase [Alphaproteobacteria bacterium]
MTDPRAVALLMALRKQGIEDRRVLEAIEKTPREEFVEEPFEHAAYDNSALPIACGQTISQPYIVAYATQALDVQPKHRVLEIGTGSGYQAAVLSPLCRMIYTVERHRPLLKQAEARFKKLKLHNVVTKFGDGFQGWPEQAPFDRILLSAAAPEVPQTLIEQLKVGGILIAPLGKNLSSESFSQHLTKIIRTEEGTTQEALIPVMFVPMLPGIAQEALKPDEKREKHSR